MNQPSELSLRGLCECCSSTNAKYLDCSQPNGKYKVCETCVKKSRLREENSQ